MVMLLLTIIHINTITVGEVEKPIVVIYAKGLVDKDVLKPLTNSITSVEWRIITGNFTFKNITDAKMLIVVKVDPKDNFTVIELSDINRWWRSGGKTLWVFGDSDHDMDGCLRINDTNSLLEAIGSVLRLENCEVVDEVSNVGIVNAIIANVNPDKPLDFLSISTSHGVLMYRSSVIVAKIDDTWHALEGQLPKDRHIYRIVWSDDNAKVVDNLEPKPIIHKVNSSGKLVLTAVEMFPTTRNLLIVSGGPLFFNNYTMWSVKVGNTTLSGLEFIRNIVLWGTSKDNVRLFTLPTVTETTTKTTTSFITRTKTVPPDITMYYSALAVMLVVIVGLAYLAFTVRRG